MTEEKKFFNKKKKSNNSEPFKLAKKDWEIVQNDYIRTIQKGDDLSDVPERFTAALVAEGVL